MRVLVALFAFAMLVPDLVHAETVVARRRLGNNVEGLTYDPQHDRAVAMDGNDVIGIALNPLDAIDLATRREDSGGLEGLGFRKLFDVLALPVAGHQPKGLLYVPPQRRYYFVTDEPGASGTIFSTDDEGHPLPSLHIQGLAQPVDFWEEMAWIPIGAPAHAGTIALLGFRNSEGVSHLFYVRLDGTVEQELVPQPGSPLETYFCGISYWPDHPTTLLLTDCSTGIFAMDAQTGAPVGNQPLTTLTGSEDYEGILVRRDGSIMVSGYEGRLFAFDPRLRRDARNDRLFTIGIGLSLRWISWNFDSGEFLGMTVTGRDVYSISGDLQRAVRVFSTPTTNELPNPFGLTYLGNNEVGIPNGGYPRGIDFAQLLSDRFEFPNGTSHLRSIWNPADGFPPGPAFNARGFSMLDQDTIVFKAAGDNAALKVVTRSGSPDATIYRDGVVPTRLPDIPLSQPTAGQSAYVFDDGSGKRIFTGAEIYRLDGTLEHVIEWQQLGLAVAPTQGVWMGGNRFATVDGFTSTVVVYSVP